MRMSIIRAVKEFDPLDAVILSIARIHHELENYGMVRRKYNELQKLDPALAMQFGYLDLRGDEAARAADASGVKTMVLWEEEE